MAARKQIRIPRTELDPGDLPFTPKNEQGVVLIFGMFAKQLGFAVENVQVRFPDCVATYRGARLRIEFEFRSGSFERHGHPPGKCDLIVCWEHRWPGAGRRYRNVPVLELSKLFGVGWNVWLQNMDSYYADGLPGGNRYSGFYSVPSQAGPDDLVLIYRPQPEAFISDLMRVATPVQRRVAEWKGDYDWMAEYQRVATLRTPIGLDELARDLQVDRNQVGRAIQGGRKLTDDWPALRRRIARTNPEAASKLERFGPNRGGY